MRLKELDREDQPLGQAVSDSTLDKLTLTNVAKGNFWALPVAGNASTICCGNLAYRNAGSAARSGSIDPCSSGCRKAEPTKNGCLTISLSWPTSIGAMGIVWWTGVADGALVQDELIEPVRAAQNDCAGSQFPRDTGRVAQHSMLTIN